MAKFYGKKNRVSAGGEAFKQLSLVSVAFLVGYLSASLCDFNHLSAWVTTHVLATPALSKLSAQPAAVPKPKLEFYTLLTNEQIPPASSVPVIPAVSVATASSKLAPSAVPVVVAASKQVASVLQPTMPASPSAAAPIRESYLVQVASFLRRQDAERMKASLSMKGFDVNIASVKQQQTTWYRVIIGPFASRSQAVQAQVTIARSERIKGMIRKMDV